MKQITGFSRQENITYLVVWGLLFLAPLLSLYVRTVSSSDVAFNWAEVFMVWRKFAVYLLLFVLHNFFLAPLLVVHHRQVTYFSVVAAVIALFTLYQCSTRPDMDKPMGHNPAMEQPGMHEPPPFDERPPHFNEPPMGHNGEHPPYGEPQLRHHDDHDPIVGEHDIMAIVMLILMFGANLGIKGYFRDLNNRRRMTELERKNLEQQLEYLRYQINPHFFMNTLNNIHALVDIDPEQAKGTILELSKMMRFVLYEGNKQGVPLARELEFIRHYVSLMQLRYTDKVRISLDLPTEVPDRQIPPLILITFIENAFKHGISYQQESFIEVRVHVADDKLQFSCHNSKPDKTAASGYTKPAPGPQSQTPKQGGVGLANVRKRLDLLYADNYSLNITDEVSSYTVKLTIPFKP
ncbi:MAG: histidine kinase [Prevotella sp.]|nr:histidine kinase [Prevotella sp.]